MNLLLAYLLTYLRDGQGHTRCRFHGSTGQSVLASTLTAATRALFHRAKKAVAIEVLYDIDQFKITARVLLLLK